MQTIPKSVNRFCGKCGSQVAAESSFCQGCGAAVACAGLTNFTRVKELFDQALSIDPASRDEWLKDACKDNCALLEELRSMLGPDGQDRFLQTPAAPPTGLTRMAPAAAAQFVGPYRLSRELGRGGMGVVYLAMRDDGAFRKNVALKVLLHEQVSPEFILRFKQERQVVAALDHPNIARILDGGDAPDGMPFYVMEYVEGLPLDQFCDQQRLSLTGRIKVFQQVCHAVNYLHQNLIVHRDLKPTNVLVSSDGVVKLLDFGIAKVVGAASLSSQELTSVQGRPMTPTYASPEQIQGATLQKTSDIYSLGVILYRLLTGRQPYEDLDDKIAKLASRKDPPLPSANIRPDLQATPESTAQLRRALLGGLDSIVLMAMRYDAKERYQSASDLAGDLQRFLDGLSVTAYHESVAGRSIKLIRRKRMAIAILAGFLVLAGFGAWQWWRVELQKAEAATLKAKLRSVLEQVEAGAGSTGSAATGDLAAKRIQDYIRNVRTLRAAFMKDFSALAADQRGPVPEGAALLDRGVRYLDKVRASSQADPVLGLEIADAYQQLGWLQESTSQANAKSREGAVKTYKKAADVLVVYAANPDNAAARQRLLRINQRITILGGGVAPAETPAPEATPSPTPALAAPKPPVETQPKIPRLVPSAQRLGPPPTAPTATAPAGKLSAADKTELDDRVISVESKIQIAEQTIAPIRQSLERTGQTLNPDVLSAMGRMHVMLERAKRDITAGDAAEAREDLAAADGFAAKVLRSIGR